MRKSSVLQLYHEEYQYPLKTKKYTISADVEVVCDYLQNKRIIVATRAMMIVCDKRGYVCGGSTKNYDQFVKVFDSWEEKYFHTSGYNKKRDTVTKEIYDYFITRHLDEFPLTIE